MRADHTAAQRSIRRHLVAGLAILLLVSGGVGGWAATAEFAGAVIAQGFLVVDSNVKKVQHPTGGVVGELKIRDGDRVKAGDVVVRLDDTQTRAQAAIVTKGLDDLAARRARLEAERDDAAEVVFARDLLARIDDPDVAHAVNGERKLFELRLAARAGQKAQLRERIAQLREEIQGLVGQEAAKEREIRLDKEELEGVRDLWRRNLVQLSRVKTLERDVARLEGESSQLLGSAAQARGKIAETELQIIQVDQDLRTDVGKELAEVRAKTVELMERKIAAEDQLKRVDIRAPQDGRVHELAVHTVGGVINPGEPIMLIVPESDSLVAEVKIAPQDIDQVRLGQRAMLRFSAFSQRTTPELDAEVSAVSPDLVQDQRTGANYYTVRIAFSPEEAGRLGDVKLVPGMPVEGFIQTGQRTVLSYLVKPLHDQVAKAFREK